MDGLLTSTINLEATSKIVSDLTSNLGDRASTKLAIEIMRFCERTLLISSFSLRKLRGRSTHADDRANEVGKCLPA